jgi:hypothetical protein
LASFGHKGRWLVLGISRTLTFYTIYAKIVSKFVLQQLGEIMGRHDPERQQAIKAALVEMEPTADEEFHDFLETCETEDSQAIEETNEFQDRVSRIYAENKRLGIAPVAWFRALQQPSIEDCMVRDALTERWEREMTVESVTDEIDDYNHRRALHDPDCRECLAIEADDRFDDPIMDQIKQDGDNYMCYEDLRRSMNMEFWDDWSGPTIPPSAIQDL